MALDHALREHADIMVSTFDRIGDEIYYIFGIKEKLKQNGLKLIFADFLEADDLVLAIKLEISKKERELISKRQKDKAAIIQKYGSRSGKPVGNPNFKTGLHKEEYMEALRKTREKRKELYYRDENNRIIASFIIETFKSGNNFEYIARKLNDMGRRTKNNNLYSAANCKKIYYKFIKYYEQSFTRVA